MTEFTKLQRQVEALGGRCGGVSKELATFKVGPLSSALYSTVRIRLACVVCKVLDGGIIPSAGRGHTAVAAS